MQTSLTVPENKTISRPNLIYMRSNLVSPGASGLFSALLTAKTIFKQHVRKRRLRVA